MSWAVKFKVGTDVKLGMERAAMPWRHRLFTSAAVHHINALHAAVIAAWVTSFQTAHGSDLRAVLGSRLGYLEVACSQRGVSWIKLK